MLTVTNLCVLQTIVFTTLMIASDFTASGDAQERLFSEGDAYERFMGRWSRREPRQRSRGAGPSHGSIDP